MKNTLNAAAECHLMERIFNMGIGAANLNNSV